MNPEFQRYLWLELTPHRLLVAPLLLAAVFALVYLSNPNDSSWPLAVAGYWVTIGLGVLWGARNAAEAVIGEVREGTWDQQRLSSLGPWSMTWGKLFGAPVFIWYACVPALVLIVFGAAARSGFVDAVGHAVLLVAVLVFAHAVGLLVSLQLAARDTIAAKRSMVGLHLLGLVAGALLVAPAYNAFMNGWSGDSIAWFAMPFTVQAFTSATIGSLVVWAVIGCYRLMRTELQMRNAPWVWIAFVVYCMAYAAGIAWTDGGIRLGQIGAGRDAPLTSALFIAYLVAMALALAMLFIEPKDPVELRRCMVSIRERRWQVLLQSIPRWLCAAPIAVLVMLVLFVNDSREAVYCASLMAFFARDAGIVVLLNLSANRRRADAAAFLYLLVLYGLLPAIINAASDLSVEGWLFPASDKGLFAAITPALVQAAVVWVLVTQRWQRLWAAVERPAGLTADDDVART
jgi:hypothetical protein